MLQISLLIRSLRIFGIKTVGPLSDLLRGSINDKLRLLL